MKNSSNDKVVLISDYGRSGQGWLSYMLCYLLNAKYVEPYDLLKGRVYTTSQHVLMNTDGNIPGRSKTKYSMIVKTHNYPASDLNLTDKIIILKRDPRDVAVSSYNMKRNTAKKESKLSLKSRIDLMVHRFPAISHAVTLSRWINYYRAWAHVDCHHVTYEGLSNDTKGELKKILSYLEIDVDDSLIEDAVDKFSFKAITGREKGSEDAGNSEFRKGSVGDYKNHFSRAELLLFKHVFAKGLGRHGYAF